MTAVVGTTPPAPGTGPEDPAGSGGVGDGGRPRGTAPGSRPGGSRVGRLLGRGVINVVLIVVALVWLVPTVGLFFSSLRSSQANAQSGWWTGLLDPSQFSIDNYRGLLQADWIMSSLWNTVLIVVPSTLLVVGLGAMAGYALAWVRFPGRDWVLVVVIAFMAVPLQVAFIPLARLFGDIGIFGSITAVVLFHTAFGLPFAIFLLRNFFMQIPTEMLEAARIDGASELRIFFRIALPLAMPSIASLAIFQFLWSWNDMLVALLFSSPDTQPITVALQSQLRQFSSNIDVLSAGAFLSMIVPLIVFFAFQRYFVNALMAGSQK